MVKLQEVEDEHFAQEQTGPKLEENEEDYYTDTDSEVSSDDEPEISLEESLSERITALKDMIPPKHRAIVTNAVSTTSWWVKRGLSLSGKTLWVVSTSALLLGVPWALAFAEEQQMVEMEKEVRMQQSANEVLTPGATNQLNQQLGQQPAHAAL
ncbi:mitochondrial import translocase, subunit Tom22 [Xylona heveae TC161]|uniref:Mitochondrial import translocase, subunit Tom22 n=1 Tax=Xylona heveae (strain CBS 132557 / TC161) TaxID=1328760 RepID=A0A165JTQ1_XYLHT|nr:mitochondrial import translocase, subunit Tom22 [Xylona heveae TC161]KZF26614.1 mitochondrial import translocase, subunit Tom22 [Xylona heveae TC161]